MSENTRPQPSTEPVAYLYESEFGDKDLLLGCNSEQARRLIELGRTEAPLYSASALEAARREERQLVMAELANDTAWIAATLAAHALKENPNAG